ncbi:MAG: PilT/PilU family type 4a pilus ATPase [Elusimicrobia bacterium]|nr:PilT/PilU family type 4a pilus ATPase [Elusimicrobiota bacterium]
MEFNELLELMRDKEASDLHLRTGSPPVMRIDGKLVTLDLEPVDAEQTMALISDFMTEKQKQTFEEQLECDLAYTLIGVGRFRINVYRQKGSVNLAIRKVPEHIKSFQELGLLPVIQALSDNTRGLILVTGTTGCGKSTTLAAMINYINETRPCHIVTIEDPIEYLFTDKKSIISQRELGFDTLNYLGALKHVVRQDPDVILLGEMRDHETTAAAITAAQTGHLVLSTIHTVNATQTVTRVVDLFPPHQQLQIRYQLADTLKGVVSQRLLPHASGKGRVPALEVLVVTPLVRKMIEDNNLSEISNCMKQGSYYGMQTFNQSLLNLYNSGEVTLEDALATASNPEELMLAVRGVESGSTNPHMGQ